MANTKVPSELIADNSVGITQLNVSDGTNGQVLTTDGAGTLSFSTISGYTDSDVETYLDGGTSTPIFSTVGIGTSAIFGTTQISNTAWSGGAPYGTVLTVTGNNTYDANWGHLLISDSTTTTGNGGMIRFATGSTTSDMNPFAGIDGFTEGSAYGGLKFLTRPSGGTATESMRINSSGTLAINTQSPSSTPLHVNSFLGNTLTAVFEAPASNNFDVQLRSHSYYGGITFYSDFYGSNTKYGEINQYINGGMYYTSTNGGHVFICNTNNSVNETMRLNGADGVLLVNRSTRFGAGGSDAMIVTGGTDAAIRITGSNTSGYKWIEFYNGGLNQIGSISNNSNTNTSFNTSSDYRLKENINDVWEATPLLKQLRPVEFNWIADETDELHHGFIAHEVDAILPFTVTGEKDAMTEPVYYVEADQEVMEGTVEAGDLKEEAKVQPQQMDYAKVVPLLVKTIQELEARIETLENS